MMHQNIGKLLPVDGFKVTVQGELQLNYQLSLTHFYQPLIGIEAVSLYQTLLSESFLKLEDAKEHTHHVLMNYMALSLDRIYQARLKLEAIGLLRVFKKEGVGGDLYQYKLIPPFVPADFLEDGMLSQLLLHHLGEKKYKELCRLFEKPELDMDEEITASFSDVFSTSQTAALNKHTDSPASRWETNLHRGPQLETDGIDIEWMKHALQKRMINPASILTPSNTKLINQMAILYDLAIHELENAIMWAINEDQVLNQYEFKSACHDLSFAARKKNKVTLTDNQELSRETRKEEVPKDKESQFVHMLETISPKQLLEDLSGGNEASPQDVKMIRDIMSQQGLSSGVMNVLVHYVLLKTDMKLSKSYMEKIASHWSRKNIQTVRQAMEIAKEENQKYQQWSKPGQQRYRQSGGKEIIPDWFKERNKKNEEANRQQTVKKETDEEEDVSEMVKNYLKNKESNHL